MSKDGLYNNSFEEFKEQFSSPKARALLYINMKKDKLYQCPYNEACECNLKEACLYCETFGEYLNREQNEKP